MPHLPSRSDDHYPGSAGRAFVASHQRHVMIHPARPQIALAKNSQPSSQRNRLVARSSETLALRQESHIPPCTSPQRSTNCSPTSSFPKQPTVCSLFVLSDSPIKTHRARISQRFSPIHF